MNHEQQELVLDLVSKKISREEFVEVFFGAEGISDGFLCGELEAAFVNKDADSLECLLIVGFLFGFSAECSNVLGRLLIQDWHISHEEIARALKPLKCPEVIESLYKAAMTKHPYIASEYALGVKCIYAIYEIGTDAAKEKLQMLTQVDNLVLSELAGRLLSSM